jgi:hypothetical protein
MKTRLTTDYSEYIKKVELKLMNPFSGDTRILYSMFPELGNGHFSIQLIEAKQPYILFRQWVQDLGESARLGVYHLQNISIEEKIINIPASDYHEMYALADSEIEISAMKGLMLDGANHYLVIFRQQPRRFHWQDDGQIGAKTKELVSRLLDRVNAGHEN